MPLYDYECKACEFMFDELICMDDREKPTRRKCPECGRKKVKQVILGAPSMVDSVNISVTKPDNSFSEVIAKINEKEGIKGTRYELHDQISGREKNYKPLTKHQLKVEVNDAVKAKKGRGK